MLKKAIVVLVVISLVVLSLAKKKNGEAVTAKNGKKHYSYPELFRDHVYTNLSENGMKIFSAVNIHPLCFERKGQCIPRAQCTGTNMLYISRVCYKRDLVCCYDNTIRFPEVADGYHTTLPNTEKIEPTTTRARTTTPLP